MISTQNFRVEHGLQIGDVVIDAASGIVSATSFFGDGSGLTGVGNAIIACCTSNFISCNTSISSITSAENNFFVGLNAGNCTTSGSNNIFLGVGAGSSNTEGSCNIFLGVGAGQFNTTGGSNIFFGKYSGASNTEGYANNFFGAAAGAANSTGFGNNYFGIGAGIFASDGQDNNFFGNLAGSGFFIDPENPGPPTPRNAGCANNFFGAFSGIANNGALSNNFFGNCSGIANTTGSYNNFFGALAGQTNTNGSYNIAIGHSVQLPNPSGNTQLAIGSGSTSWINGNENFNVGIGTTSPQYKLDVDGDINFTGTLYDNGIPFSGGGSGAFSYCCTNNITSTDLTSHPYISGAYNNFFAGVGAGCSITTGCNNNFFGPNAGQGRIGRITSVGITTFTTLVGEASNTYSNVSGTGGSGSNATFYVERDGGGDVTIVNITIEGQNYNVGNTLTIDGGDVGGSSGTDDVTITINAVAGSTGNNNNFLGSSAGRENTTGGYNNFFGNDAGRNNTNGCYNNFFGDSAGRYNTEGGYNNFLGAQAGRYNTTGCYNNFFGYFAGYNNTTGCYNNFLGDSAGYNNTTGDYNNFLGPFAGYNNTTGCYNNFLGDSAGYNNTTGCYNNFFGPSAGYNNTTGDYNNFLGYRAGYYNTEGGYNNFFGPSAGYYNTTGTHNTFLGSVSGISTSASRKIIIGSGESGNYFDAPDTTKDNQFAVGIRTDVNPANYWLVGDENFNVGIGTTSPQYKLDVGGDAKISDIRISGTQIIGGGSTLGSIQLIPNETLTGQGQYVNLRPTANLDQTHIHIEAGNVNNADLYLGDDDRFVKIDHTGPVVIGVPSTATTSNWTAPSDDGPTAYIIIDTDVYPWAQYLTLGDTVTLPDTTVVNIINNSLSGNSMSLYLDSNISYLTSDILVFSYTPRTEWKFNSDSSAVFPGIVTATSFVGNGSGLTNLPTPSRTTVTGITTIISSGGIGNTDISGFKTYLLLKVGISTEAWIRIYTDSDSRSNDASRPINIDPTSGSGIVAEFVSVGATTIKTGPSLIGYNDDDPEENIIYMSVNNLSGISTSIEVNLTILKMEE